MAKNAVIKEHFFSRLIILGLALGFLAIFVVMPLAIIFVEALKGGFGAYFSALKDPDAIKAIQLTLTVAAIAVPLNIVFGICASYAITKFDFLGN